MYQTQRRPLVPAGALGDHRAGDFADAVQRAIESLPITRVHNVNRLDWLGLDIGIAVTPTAEDLTVHSGRGQNDHDARLGAVMEAIERCSAERGRFRGWSWLGSRTELVQEVGAEAVVDPTAYCLPYDTRYGDDLRCEWVEAQDLLSGRTMHVPADLVFSPARDGVCRGVETNGLGAGDTLERAVIHAVLEMVERDAVATDLFLSYMADNGRHRRKVLDLRTAPDRARSIIEDLQRKGVQVVVRVLESRTGIPVFAVDLTDPSYTGTGSGQAPVFAGFGCSLSAADALDSALLEAAQGHAGWHIGARDDFEGVAGHLVTTDHLLSRARLLHGPGRERFDPGHVTSWAYDAETLATVLDALGDDVEHCLMVDLSSSNGGVPVVRVLLPGYFFPFPDSCRSIPDTAFRALLRTGDFA